MTLLSAHQASKQLGVSSRTLRRWHAQGLIKAERTYSGIHLYDINHVLSSPTLISFVPTASLAPTEQPFKYIYARVSSPKQRSDLERQKQHLQQLYPSHLILTDIASGINWKRPGLKTLLERSSRGLVTEVGFIFLFFSLCQGLLKSLALCTGCGCPQRPTLSFCL
jgi:putative resolvase